MQTGRRNVNIVSIFPKSAKQNMYKGILSGIDVLFTEQFGDLNNRILVSLILHFYI